MQPRKRKLAVLCLAAMVALVLFVLAGSAFSCGRGCGLASRLAARFGRHRAEASQYIQPAESPTVVADMGPEYEARPCAGSPTGYAWFKIEIDFGPKPKPQPVPPQPEPKHHWPWPLFSTPAPAQPAAMPSASEQPRSCNGGSCPCNDPTWRLFRR